MNKLIEETKFLEDLRVVERSYIESILSKHLKDIVDEPQHPSGMDRENINVRNKLRKELREE